MEAKYLKVIEVLSEAIMDKDKRIDFKKAKIKEYEKEIAELKSKIEQIEQYVDYYKRG